MYKVMIVDDEPVIRTGLKQLIPWDELNMKIVCEAGNGSAALEHLRHGPVDILITDIRMDGMDGLTLVEEARALNENLHCIILTGYDDFAYTQHAIRLGIDNYILKPVDEKELMETLSHIEDKLLREEIGEKTLAKDKQILMQLVLTRWLSGTIDGASLRHRANYLKIPLDCAYVQACILRVLDVKDTAGSPTVAAAARQHLGAELIAVWKPIRDAWMHVCWEAGSDLVMVFSGELIDKAGAVKAQIDSFIKQMARTQNIQIFAALGSLQEDALFLSASFQDARKVAELSLIFPQASILEYDAQYFTGTEKSVPTIDHEKLENAISRNDRDVIHKIWSDWALAVTEATPDPKLIKNYAAETMCRLIVLRADTFRDQSDTPKERIMLEHLFAANTVNQLVEQLKSYSISLAEQLEQRRLKIHPTVQRIIELTERDYRSELTLYALADQLNANPVYIGRLFKEETGQTYSAYLNQVRMHEAKRLLLETKMTVTDISAAVGYSSPGYFTSQFKKAFSCFPREFRSKRS